MLIKKSSVIKSIVSTTKHSGLLQKLDVKKINNSLDKDEYFIDLKKIKEMCKGNVRDKCADSNNELFQRNSLDVINPNHSSFNGEILSKLFSCEMDKFKQPLDMFLLLKSLMDMINPSLKSNTANEIELLQKSLIKNILCHLSCDEREKLKNLLTIDVLFNIASKVVHIQGKYEEYHKLRAANIMTIVSYLADYLHPEKEFNNEIDKIAKTKDSKGKPLTSREQKIFNEFIKDKSINELCGADLDIINPKYSSFDGEILSKLFSREMDKCKQPLDIFLLLKSLTDVIKPQLKNKTDNDIKSLQESLINNIVIHLECDKREKLVGLLTIDELLDIASKAKHIHDKKRDGYNQCRAINVMTIASSLALHLHHDDEFNTVITEIATKDSKGKALTSREEQIFNELIKDESINELLCGGDLDIINPVHIAFDGEVLAKAFSLEMDKMKHPLELVAVFDKLKKMLVPTFEKITSQDDLMSLKESLITRILEHLSDKELQKLTRLLGKEKLKDIAAKINYFYDCVTGYQQYYLIEILSIITLLAKHLYNDEKFNQEIEEITLGNGDVIAPTQREQRFFNELIDA